MHDRLGHAFISKCLFKFSRGRSARYHLVIDHKFAKGLYSNSIDIRKFYNAQSFEIEYVFRDSNHEIFEKKYYSMIAQILSKSPLMHTLKWELQYRQFRCKLTSSSPAHPYYGHTGHLLEWMDKIKASKNSVESVFKSVTKLVYVPSQYKEDDYDRSRWRTKFDLFQSMLPNVISFIMPQTRLCSQDSHAQTYDDSDFEWKIFKSSTHNKRIQHIECDLMKNTNNHPWWRQRRLSIQNHPLSHFNKFLHLRSLKLTLPLFKKCINYYSPFVDNNQSHSKCLNLQDLSLRFDIIKSFKFDAFNRRRLNDQIPKGCDFVIDKLCKFVLSLCSSVRNYTLLGPATLDLGADFDHLIGFYDQIDSLKTNIPSIIPIDARMTALKKFTLVLHNISCWDFASLEQRALLNFNGFPNLEVVNYFFIGDTNEKMRNNESINECLEFLSEQTKIPKLKHIAIYHEARSKQQWQRNFNLSVSKKESLELCKLLISMCSISSNFKIESIVLNPVKLKKKELEYLDFWFGGKVSTTNYHVTSDTVLTDLTLLQSD